MSAVGTQLVELRRFDAESRDFEREFAALIAFDATQDAAVDAAVAAIVADVRDRGDAALLEYTAKLDRFSVPSAAALEIPAAEMRAAFDALAPTQRAALETAAARVHAYHDHQKLGSWSFCEADGSELGAKVTPLDRVGVYVPAARLPIRRPC
jgi:histidinol dehydrogenase